MNPNWKLPRFLEHFDPTLVGQYLKGCHSKIKQFMNVATFLLVVNIIAPSIMIFMVHSIFRCLVGKKLLFKDYHFHKDIYHDTLIVNI